jgi:hypothetical protein
MIAPFVGLLVAPGLSSAQEMTSGDKWLTWSAPPECPQAEHIEAQLKHWLGDEYEPAAGEVTSWATVTWRDEVWTVEVHLRRGDDESTRSVVVGSCTEAADFVALSVALLVNPEVLPAEASEPVLAQETETAAPEPEQKPEPDTETDEAPVSEDSDSPPEEKNPSPFVLGAGLGLRTGVFAVASPVAFARVGLRPGAWRMHLGAASIPHVKYTPQAAENPAVFRSLVGQAEVCRLFAKGAFAVGPCLGLEAGALSAQERGAPSTTLFWSAGQLLGALELAWGWGAAFLHVGAQIPFTRPEFLLEGGTVVHQSQAGLDTKLGISIFL